MYIILLIVFYKVFIKFELNEYKTSTSNSYCYITILKDEAVIKYYY